MTDAIIATVASKVVEKRVRRRARRLGYYVTKSREWNNAGEYMLCDERSGSPIFGWNYDASLEEIEDFLQQEEAEAVS